MKNCPRCRTCLQAKPVGEVNTDECANCKGTWFDQDELRQVEKQPKSGAKLAGLVLAVIGALTYGSTSPFGLVLCVEWLFDPNRSRVLRLWDWVGLMLAVPGATFFIFMSVCLFDYAPGPLSFAGMITIYWVFFGVWLLVRSLTRWRGLRESRTRGPVHLTEPGDAADGGI